MDGDDDLWADPLVHRGELGPAGMAGDVDLRLAVGDHPDAPRGKLVLDPADGDLVAGDLLRREDDEIPFRHAQLVLAEGDPGERGAALALAAGGDDHDVARRKLHRRVEVDRLGEVGQIADALGDPQDTVERAAGDADPPAGIGGDVAEGPEAGRVGGEGGDQHPPLRLADHPVEPLAHRRL
jgi:hypothetical protein